MASATVTICDICTNTFNDGDRQSMVLPCGHDYCLTCLANLEAKKVYKCPSCRRNWRDLGLQKLPGIESVKIVMKTEVEQDDELGKKNQEEEYRCKKHMLPFDFWVKDDKMYFCKRCAAENRNICFELIEDVIPDIKTDLSLDVQTVTKKIKNDLESLEEKKLQLIKVKGKAHKFANLVMSFLKSILTQVEQIDASMLEANRTTDITKEVAKNIAKIQSEADINIIMQSKGTLQQFMKTSSMPAENPMTKLLSEIICSYMKEAESPDTQWNSTTKTAFIKTLVYGTRTSGHQKTQSVGSAESRLICRTRNSTEHSLDQALKGGVSMYYNIYARTLLALVGDSNELQLQVKNVEQYEQTETSPTSRIKVHFKDSFLKPMDVKRDHMRLKMVKADKRLYLTEFYGYLDAAGIAELPKTIRVLGLAIGSSADSVALHNLRIWPKLECLKVSVDSKILLHDLKPLPGTLGKDIGIPYLTDDVVDNVVPAINALVPHQRFQWLVFPKCRLTTAGVRRLLRQIQGIPRATGVILEFSDKLMPDEKTQAAIKAEFLYCSGYNVFFDSNGSILLNTF